MIGKIFGTKKAIGTGLATIDKLVLTSQEKSDRQMKFLELYEPFKRAQRVLATIILPPYMLAWIVTFFASFFTDTSTQDELLNGRVGDLSVLIGAFYFGGGAFESIFKYFTKK